jgi:glyoxylase I family protein
MTTTTTTEPTPESMRPALAGIHHIGLTVRDQASSADWYCRVLGLVRLFEEPHHDSPAGGSAVVVGTPDLRYCIGLDRHPSHAGEPFDATRTGLDHLSFLVETAGDLRGWCDHLTACEVEHSGGYQVPGIPATFVTFRDPDGVQLELVAMQG